ncbi:cupin domain-containing protein [Bradyrhizobium sp. CCGUVB14]|uniref:cupin domain-containing protein n=1 Tax=Bradyrhizobium sp. CCGUVB14 TaxID=2949628 RepID=UPI0020B3BC63|nr:cupin domain-containing protein [Bradyrhizobium sp. CCGUVB14]MCP3447614.1 cupin domain-containing protein [Bradyrhizobium sp. CCGUVB14]
MTYAISTGPASSLIGLATASLLMLSGSVPAFAQDAVVATLPQDIHFKGSEGAVGIAVLYGDPKKAEVFSERVRIPAGFKIMPHWHGETRTAVVLSGTFYYANGDQWDESKLKAYPPGSFLIEPTKISHYAMAKDGEVVLQATAVGPASTTRIEQARK